MAIQYHFGLRDFVFSETECKGSEIDGKSGVVLVHPYKYLGYCSIIGYANPSPDLNYMSSDPTYVFRVKLKKPNQ